MTQQGYKHISFFVLKKNSVVTWKHMIVYRNFLEILRVWPIIFYLLGIHLPKNQRRWVSFVSSNTRIRRFIFFKKAFSIIQQPVISEVRTIISQVDSFSILKTGRNERIFATCDKWRSLVHPGHLQWRLLLQTVRRSSIRCGLFIYVRLNCIFFRHWSPMETSVA